MKTIDLDSLAAVTGGTSIIPSIFPIGPFRPGQPRPGLPGPTKPQLPPGSLDLPRRNDIA
jgi:hypothetical protein